MTSAEALEALKAMKCLLGIGGWDDPKDRSSTKPMTTADAQIWLKEQDPYLHALVAAYLKDSRDWETAIARAEKCLANRHEGPRAILASWASRKA